jgi:hypothetical protein
MTSSRSEGYVFSFHQEDQRADATVDALYRMFEMLS